MPWEWTCKCSKCGKRSNGNGTDGWFTIVKDGPALTIIPVAKDEAGSIGEFCGLECTLGAVSSELRGS